MVLFNSCASNHTIHVCAQTYIQGRKTQEENTKTDRNILCADELDRTMVSGDEVCCNTEFPSPPRVSNNCCITKGIPDIFQYKGYEVTGFVTMIKIQQTQHASNCGQLICDSKFKLGFTIDKI